MTATTVNQESSAAAPIVQEIFCDLDVIASRCTELPHSIITPPFIGWALHASHEVASPNVDNGVEIIDEMLTE